MSAASEADVGDGDSLWDFRHLQHEALGPSVRWGDDKKSYEKR